MQRHADKDGLWQTCSRRAHEEVVRKEPCVRRAGMLERQQKGKRDVPRLPCSVRDALALTLSVDEAVADFVLSLAAMSAPELQHA